MLGLVYILVGSGNETIGAHGEEVARELISVLSVTYGVRSSNLLASMRDRASVNNVAMRTLKVV